MQGVRFQAHPTEEQRKFLSQWMGCARYIWNAKCYADKQQREGETSLSSHRIDQTYAHFKSKEETPWLFDCPSVILRNAVANWYATYRHFFKKICGRPKPKRNTGFGSIHLTRELFEFVKGEDGVTRLFIGAKKHSIGQLVIKTHRRFKVPNSIYIKKRYDRYHVSFCYEETTNAQSSIGSKALLKELRQKGEGYLAAHTIGIDRGVRRPVQCSDMSHFFDLTEESKAKKWLVEKHLKRFKKKLARQKKGSHRRYFTKKRLARQHEKLGNIRSNFCHQTSRSIVSKDNARIFVLEDLGTSRMTRKPKVKQDNHGKWLKNNARAKAGLNRSILDKSWHQFATFLTYKAARLGKVVYKVAPHHTSQECAHCHHIHPHNRKSQSRFQCRACGHTDNADENAAKVIKQRAIQLILRGWHLTLIKFYVRTCI